MNPSICLFSYVCPIPVYDEPREDRRVSGQPRRTTWNHYDSDDGVVSAGVWACETGRWRIAFAADKEEFFAVLEGRVRLWDADGVAVEVRAGDAAVSPAGFRGEFEVCEPVRKFYVVVSRNGGKAR